MLRPDVAHKPWLGGEEERFCVDVVAGEIYAGREGAVEDSGGDEGDVVAFGEVGDGEYFFVDCLFSNARLS